MTIRTRWLLSSLLCVLCLSTSPAVAPAQSLTAIEISPAKPRIGVGHRQLFTATGTFDDGSQHPLGWTARTPMKYPRFMVAAGVVDGIIYVVGGTRPPAEGLSTVEAYDPVADTWRTRAPLRTGRDSLGVGVVDGILYTVGGHNLEQGGCLSTVEAYDPKKNRWTARSPMPVGSMWAGVGVVNGILYVVGGHCNGFNTLQAYDPATNTWTVKTPMPIRQTQLAVGVVDGILYAVGGYNPDEQPPLGGDVQAYDPSTDSWTVKASVPTGRTALAVGVVNGILYAIGGTCLSCDSRSHTVEAYNPADNTWTSAPPLSVARELLGVAVVNGTLYAVGGLDDLGTFNMAEAFKPPSYPPPIVTWSSSDESVADFPANTESFQQVTGEARGQSIGVTTITASAGAISGNTELEVVDPTAADLVLSDLSTATTAVAPGRRLSLSSTVTNQGLGPGPRSTVAFSLSLNAVVGDGDDIPLSAVRPVSQLAPGESKTATKDLTVPSTTPPGTYYICGYASPAGADSDPINNGSCTTSTVLVVRPDLIVSQLTPNAGSVAQGAKISVTGTVVNQSPVTVRSSIVSFRLSASGVWGDTDNVLLLTKRPLPAIGVSASNAFTMNVSVPAATPPGDYHICAMADARDVVAETDEANNTFCSSTPVTVLPAP